MANKKKSKNNPPFPNKTLSKPFIFIFLFLFLLINIFSSQTISPFFLGIADNNKQAVVNYLKKIKDLPFFKDELKKFSQIFDKNIAKEVFKDEEETKIKIKRLEAVLEKNQKDPEILYSLYLLYNRLGENKKAQDYLKKAKQINPKL